MDLDELCNRCEHPWNPHILVATMYSVEHGGLIFCDVPDCKCVSSWTIEGREEPYFPSPDEVEDLRLMVQYGMDEESSEEAEDEAQTGD